VPSAHVLPTSPYLHFHPNALFKSSHYFSLFNNFNFVSSRSVCEFNFLCNSRFKLFQYFPPFNFFNSAYRSVFDFNSFSHFIYPFFSFCGRVRSSISKAAVLPFTIASINLNNSSLTSIAQFLDRQTRQIDVLCVQEVSRRQAEDAVVLVPHSNQLSHFNRVNRLAAQAVFLTSRVGIIIFNPSVIIRSQEVLPRLVSVQLTTDQPICLQATRTDHITIVSVYAPVHYQQRKTFFEVDLARKIEQIVADREAVVMMGDFNDFEFPFLDRWPPFEREKDYEALDRAAKRRVWEELLTPVLLVNKMIDAFRFRHPDRQDFSRYQKSSDGSITSATRLDHTLITEELSDCIHDVFYTTLSFTDHRAMLVYINDTVVSEIESHAEPAATANILVGPGVWKLYHGALTEHYFCARNKFYADQLIGSSTLPKPFTMETWQNAKDRLRMYALRVSLLTGQERKQPGRKMTEIQLQLDQLDINSESDRLILPELLGDLRRYHNLLVIDDSRRFGHRIPRSQCFPNKKRVARPQFITKLKASENCSPQSAVQQKRDIALDFYRNLYTISSQFDPQLALDLLRKIPPDNVLTQVEIDALKIPLSIEELQKALSRCSANSAPGMDGLPFEFWKNISHIISEPLAQVCDHIQAGLATPPTNWPTLIGSLLHKKGDKQLLTNYRLLSIMDSDLRWRSTALLDRMMPLFETFISEEQTAFMKYRQISDNIMAMMLALEEMRQPGNQAVILALDQEKAYDRVRREWLFCVLEYIGLPQEMLNSIKYSYQEPVVRISINKHLTPALRLRCGVLQGDPLSVLLYIISIQPLLYALKSKNIGIPVTYQNKTALLSSRAHADDLSLFLADSTQYVEAHSIVQQYCSLSNAVINQKKNRAIYKEQDSRDWRSEIEMDREEDDYVHMGCPMRPDGQSPDKFLQSLLSRLKVACVVANLNDRPLSSRVEYANTRLLSQIWHSVQLCPVYFKFFRRGSPSGHNGCLS